jgi:hypothetical protein
MEILNGLGRENPIARTYARERQNFAQAKHERFFRRVFTGEIGGR